MSALRDGQQIPAQAGHRRLVEGLVVAPDAPLGRPALRRSPERIGCLSMQNLGSPALTHSSRRTDLARCSADFLTRRFADLGRLAPVTSDIRPIVKG